MARLREIRFWLRDHHGLVFGLAILALLVALGLGVTAIGWRITYQGTTADTPDDPGSEVDPEYGPLRIEYAGLSPHGQRIVDRAVARGQVRTLRKPVGFTCCEPLVVVQDDQRHTFTIAHRYFWDRPRGAVAIILGVVGVILLVISAYDEIVLSRV